MALALVISSILLLLFAVLALLDGVYLHIFKYQLHRHPESRFEHLTHTLRAIFFPLILYFLLLQQDAVSFGIGIGIVLLDVFVLAVDAYSEKDSRVFMGGLPRWEYILHLMVNGFHFASIAVFLSIKLNWTASGLAFTPNIATAQHFNLFRWVVVNLLPGSVLVAALHVWVLVPRTASIWDRWRAKITCC